ncbi:hypothetical protein PGT21_003333 [Puccinia graminis f. sp. tritici]|uniref:Uncharacterized protein n=1 Tax=Puccinia graminis f. sp. tritici TaxID=56615 RepID=A0A5B0PJK2_PUCGR|nr:hypothetical protein PGT21_003333 [Puccinia graminis f. sp. tritici]
MGRVASNSANHGGPDATRMQKKNAMLLSPGPAPGPRVFKEQQHLDHDWLAVHPAAIFRMATASIEVG